MIEIIDDQIGTIRLIPNARAKRVIARMRDGMLQITHPSRMPHREIISAIEELKPKLLALQERDNQGYIFTPDSPLVMFSFSVNIKASSLSRFYASVKDGVLSITYPQTYNYEDDIVQTYARNAVEKLMRSEAKRIFPPKVKALAAIHNFKYRDVKINKSRSRWGSCSSKGSINFSYYCMLLPEYLIDFIILHELCHTLEMNHGDRFWALLDKVSGGKAKAFTKDLKNYKTRW